MANRDHKVVHEEPPQKSGHPGLNVVMVVIAVVGVVLGADQYIDNEFAGLKESISRLSTDTSNRFDTLNTSLSDLSTSTSGHLKAVNDSLSALSTSTSGHLKAVNDSLSALSTSTSGHLKAVEHQLLHLPNNIRPTFDTVYVFKHTFDFPKPSFKLEKDEARDLLCTRDELPTTDELRKEKELYRKEIFAFDARAKFKFYTMGQRRGEDKETMIRQEISCYKRTRGRNEAEPSEKRIAQAPVVIRLEPESTIYDDDNGGTWSPSNDPSFDHDDGDSKTYIFSGLPVREGPQVHSLTATIADRDKSSRERCQDYEIKVATGKLDRCDLEMFVFAYLDSPPLPRPPTTEE